MGAQFLVIVATLTLVLQNSNVNGQSGESSTYGKEFYLGFLNNIGGSDFTNLEVVVGTRATSAQFKIETNDGVIHEGTSTSSSPTAVSVASSFQVANSEFANRHKGLHIYSTGSESIYILVKNFITFVNLGAYLAYPCIRFETDAAYEYVVVSADDPDDLLNSEFLLVGCENDTEITIVPTQTVSIPQDPQDQDSAMTTVDLGTTSHQIILHTMQTLLISSVDDLTGTKIISNKPLTVISGHECANIPSSRSSCEPLAVHVPPTFTWGTEFLLAPFAGRRGNQTFKAVTSENSTFIATVCGTTFTEERVNTVFQLDTNKYCYLESTKPVLLTQLSFGGSIDNMGDPSIALISPTDQYIRETEFFSLPTSEFTNNYISITVRIEHYNPDIILLDGAKVNCEWHEIYNNTVTFDIVGYGCNTTVSSNFFSHTRHIVTHSDANGLISVHAYGFGAFPVQGYAYLTGQELQITDVEPPVEDIPFVDLKTFPGALELKREIDAHSDPIIIPRGLLFGGTRVTSAYVNENGVISFDKPWMYSYPEPLPTENFDIRTSLSAATFWSDNDIRKEGAVRYATYNSLTDTNSAGRMLLEQVNNYILTLQEERGDEERFVGRWMLIAHWDGVHPSPHGGDDHGGISEEELNRTNNYQAILVTNSIDTYVIYTYICGEMQWSSLGQSRAAVVGYNAEGNFFQNHPSSGFAAIAETISCGVNQERRRKRQNDRQRTRMPLQFPTDPEKRRRAQTCNSFFEREVFLLNLSPADLARDVANYPCPPKLDQAEIDAARYVLQTAAPLCYVSSLSGTQRNLRNLVIISATQQCCYDNTGALQTSRYEGFAGTVLIHHPLLDRVGYERVEKAYRDSCCGIEGYADFCDLYFDQRVINTGDGYEPPLLATGSGDPHYRTFDGRYYTFNGFGEFILMEALSEDGNTPVFTLQGRTGMVSFWRVTTHLALAFGDPQLAFHFGMSPGFRVWQTKPGIPVEITEDLVEGEIWSDRTKKSTLRRNGNQLTAAFFESGIILIASANPAGNPGEYYINFQIRIPKQTYFRKTRGFLGTLDDDSTNDFHRRESTTPLPNTISERDLKDHLLTWQVHRAESLFFYAEGRRKRQTYEDFQNLDFVPIFLDELTFTEEQKAACGDHVQCLFDLAVTGEMEFANNTLKEDRVANETKEMLENFPPNISADAVFRVTIGMESIYILTVIDPGDNFTLSIQGGLPINSVLEEVEDEYIFRWTLMEVTNEPLVFIANDSRGAVSTFSPVVEVCACVNGGACTREGVITSNATITLRCMCTEAFSGDFCEEDRNGCSEIQCFEGVECMDIPAPGVGAVCGSCPDGYTGDATKCYDIDECTTSTTDLCHQDCINTDGSYTCGCYSGYQLIEGTNQCEDINECDDLNDCEQLCMNTEGSYSCSCTMGFDLADDGRKCNAKQLCVDGGSCSHICAVVDFEEKCFCPIGFNLTTPTQCTDINECLISPCDQFCNNTRGSFECSCTSGYGLQGDGRTCRDIDECFEAAVIAVDICQNDSNTRCVNTEGSFNCVCVAGYHRVDGLCERIEDEKPPPPPPVVTPATGEENSVNYTAPNFTPELFTPSKQQQFRVVTANILTELCSVLICDIVVSSEETKNVTDLKVEPMNIAIPPFLIGQNDEGQLQFSLYVQFSDGFLAKEYLEIGIELGEQQYTEIVFRLPPTTAPPVPTTEAQTTPTTTTTQEPTTSAAATTDQPTTPEPPITTAPPTTEAQTTEMPTTVPAETSATTTEVQTTPEPATTTMMMATTTEIPTTESPVTTTEIPTTESPVTTEPLEIPPEPLIVDFKVLTISSRTLRLAESSAEVPQISIELIGSSVGTLTFHILPLTYDEYEARYPHINLDDIFPIRPLNPAGDSDFNKTSLTYRGPTTFTPHGAIDDSNPELEEGFLYFLEVDRANSDPRDYNRLQFLNRHILGIIIDDDAIVSCSSNVFDNAVSVACSGTDELPPEENTQCSIDFATPENCSFPFDIARSELAPGQHNLQVYSRKTGEAIPDNIVGGAHFYIESLKVYFVNDTPTLTGDSIYAEIGINRPEGTIECHLTQSSDTRKDCSNGTYKIDGISPGDYTLRIVARDPRRPSSEKAVLRSRIKMRSSDVCVVHLVNDGITVEGNTVIVDFLTTGNVEPTGYLCSLDRARFVECGSPYIIENVPIGEHRIKVAPQGCGQLGFTTYTQRFSVF